MTPKEKAIELVDKMYHYQWREKQRAKECALIAVDEILKNDTIFLYVHHFDFWQQVKQEIEKI